LGFGFVARLDLTVPASRRAALEAAWLADAVPVAWPPRSWSDLLADRLDTNGVSALRALRRAGRLRAAARGGRFEVSWRAALSEDDASLAGTAARLLGIAAPLEGDGALVVASDGTAPVPGWQVRIVRPPRGGSAKLRALRLADCQAEEACSQVARDLLAPRRPR
jgi:hypothetical protein